MPPPAPSACCPGSPAPRRSRLGWAVVVLLVLAGLCLAPQRRGARIPDPTYAGRRASAWLEEVVRTSEALGRDEEHLRHLEARLALLNLGTQAVPVLLDAALEPKSDGPLRRLLREVAEETGGAWLRPGSFAPPRVRVAVAEGLLATIRPPATQVAARLPHPLDPRTPRHWAALTLLSRTADAASTMASLLTNLLTHPRTADPAAFLLANAVRDTSDAPGLLAQLDSAAPATREHFGRARLLGVLQPKAEPAPAWLDTVLTNQTASDLDRIGAAVAALELEPGHVAATALLNLIVDQAGFTPWNHLTNPPARVLCDIARNLWPGRITTPATLDAIERLARRQVEGWNERGLEHGVCSALERTAPERAAPLYRTQMTSTNRDNLRIVAAGSLLRVRRTDADAVRFLADYARRDHHLARMAVEQLGEADSRAAIEALERIARDAPDTGAASLARVSLKRIEVRAFEQRRGGAP